MNVYTGFSKSQTRERGQKRLLRGRNLRDEKVSARKPWVGASKLVHTDRHVPIQGIENV